MATPVSAKAHQTQLPATPLRRTMSVTRLGVSLLKVVATMDRPASHQGTARPGGEELRRVLARPLAEEQGRDEADEQRWRRR